MADIQQWVIDNAVELGVIVVTGLVGFGKMKGWMQVQSEELQTMRKDFEKHMEAEVPHSVCRVESGKLESLNTSLDEIRSDVKEVRALLIGFIAKNPFGADHVNPLERPKR